MDHPGVDLGTHTFFDTDILFGKGGRKKVPSNLFPAETGPNVALVNGKLVDQTRTQGDSSDDFDAANVTISQAVAGDPVVLLPHDTLRARSVITNYGLFDVLIGKLSSGLTSGNGYILKAGTATVAGQTLETFNQGRLFGVVIPSAAPGSVCMIGVFIERNNS